MSHAALGKSQTFLREDVFNWLAVFLPVAPITDAPQRSNSSPWQKCGKKGSKGLPTPPPSPSQQRQVLWGAQPVPPASHPLPGPASHSQPRVLQLAPPPCAPAHPARVPRARHHHGPAASRWLQPLHNARSAALTSGGRARTQTAETQLLSGATFEFPR